MQGENRTMLWIVVGVILILVVGVLVVLLTNNNNTQTVNNNTTTETNDDSSEEALTEASFTLSEQNDSGQSGSVLLEQVGDNQVRVTISLSNPTSTAEPAHIHTGSCPTPGGILFGLEDVIEGTSVSTINTTLASLKASGAIAINIHKSAAESSVYFACGDLDFE